MEELLDLVDENDDVVGKTTKSEAHAKGLIHRIAVVYVFDNDGKLLVQLRKKDGKLDHSAAGHLKAGEDYLTGAIRELREELGIKRTDFEHLGNMLSDECVDPDGPNKVIHHFSLFETDLGRDTIVPSPEEVAEMTPMTLEEIAEDMRKNPDRFATGFKATLNFYIDKKRLGIKPIPI